MSRGERVLVDTGPLVAIFDADDRHHEVCATTLRRLRGSLFTAWPAVTEAMYLLSFSEAACDGLLGWLQSGSLAVLELQRTDLQRVRELLAKYADLPMDFTDAVIVSLAERERIRNIFTVDERDFRVYKPKPFRHFNLLPARDA